MDPISKNHPAAQLIHLEYQPGNSQPNIRYGTNCTYYVNINNIFKDFNSGWQTATIQSKINTYAKINFKNKMYNDKQ